MFLTHYYPPEVGAAQARISALARGLAERGITVTVHTGFPHYPDGIVAQPYTVKRAQRENDGQVRVLRTWVHVAPNRGVVRRLVGHATFAAGAVAVAHRVAPADVVVAESPPLFTAAGAVEYARRLHAPLILNCSDLWPESAIAVGALKGRAPIAAAEWLERRCYAHAAAVTVPVAGMVAAAAARGARAQVIGPAVDVERFAGVEPISPTANGPLRVLYAGTLGLAQGLDTVVRAARRAGPEVVQLTLAGDGAEAGALNEAAAGADNVELIGTVPGEAIPALYGRHDMAIVPLLDRPVFAAALPTKLFEAIAAGRGVVVSAPAGEATRLITETRCGVAVLPEDAAALESCWRELQADPTQVVALGAAGPAVAARHDRALIVEEWADLLERTSAGSALAATGRQAP